MRKATVTFTQCIQDSQDFGSDDEHMMSRVFFDLEVDGKVYPDLYSDINQTTGSGYETAAIEVSEPHGYNGPFNYMAFRDEVEKYYRSLVGPTATGIRVGEGARNIRMRNNILSIKKAVQFNIDA